VALQKFIDTQIRPLGLAVMERVPIRSGQDVLDVGCGCGDTTLELARRVAPGGTVTGIDISTVMLEQARAAARDGKLGNIRFANADAQTHAFEPGSCDVVFSRFGVMFFAQPEAAFTNLHRALRTDGKLAFICWQPLSENPWMAVPLMAALQHIPPPPIPPPGAPGPFAFGDAERVRGILSAAGFKDIGIEPLCETLTIGGGYGLDQVVDFLLQMGPTGTALRDATPELLERVAGSVRDSLQPYVTEKGVRMPSAAWLVTA
jgi:SAM-dependent methyltransferase